MYKNALISVSNKEGLIECVSVLCKNGTRIVSTGGTAKHLQNAGLPITFVRNQTQFPEVMGGRVKTLHPHIFLPLLARSFVEEDNQELKKRNLEHFDLVICNLYPFESHQESSDRDQMDWVDVGGPSMLRASAKNFEKITTIYDPKDYHLLKKQTSLKQRKQLASKVFSYLSRYDQAISEYLSGSSSCSEQKLKNNTSDTCLTTATSPSKGSSFCLKGQLLQTLRYGENPQQEAHWYSSSSIGLHQAKVIQGKPLSFNNILDVQSAISVLREFSDTPCFVGIKHNNPCSLACASSLSKAIQKGLQSDPLSIFGGVIACNQQVDANSANQLSSLFLECVIAHSFSEEALDILKKKKNLRLLSWKDWLQINQEPLVYRVDGGFLTQDSDQVECCWKDFQIYGEAPSALIKKDLEMAWKVCAHLNSNAISLVCDQQTVGLGMGQVDRITAVDLAFQRMHKYHPHIQGEVVMASDGFFPFSDSVEKAARMGIRWLIQPGGSVKDKEVLKVAQEKGICMICTGKRHFKH